MSRRFCPNGHDTWEVGRTGDTHTCKLCQKQRNARKSARDKAIRREKNKPEYVPGLRAYRYKCGYSLTQIAWESGLSRDTIWRIEMEIQKASRDQREKLLVGFQILKRREREETEKIMEEEKRLIRAGIA